MVTMNVFGAVRTALLTMIFAAIAGTASADRAALDAVNSIRAQAGLATLRHATVLEGIARRHAKDIASRRVLSHYGRNGASPSARATKAGYGWCQIAENLARGQRDINQTIREWMASPAHRAQMLDPNLREMGLARTSDNYWVLVLGRPGC